MIGGFGFVLLYLGKIVWKLEVCFCFINMKYYIYDEEIVIIVLFFGEEFWDKFIVFYFVGIIMIVGLLILLIGFFNFFYFFMGIFLNCNCEYGICKVMGSGN